MVLGSFLGGCGTFMVFPANSTFCFIIGYKLGNFWGYSWLVTDQREVGVSSSIPSLFFVSSGETRNFRFHSWFVLHWELLGGTKKFSVSFLF